MFVALATVTTLTALIAPALAAPLSGSYTLAEPRGTVQARVDQAVAAALAEYPSPIAAIARPRLAAKATFCERYTLTASDVALLVSCDGDPPVPGVFDAPAAPWTSRKGDAVRLTTTRVGDAVEIRFDAEGGHQRVRYTPTAEGLIVEKVLHSDQLDLELSWTMTYRKQP